MSHYELPSISLLLSTEGKEKNMVCSPQATFQTSGGHIYKAALNQVDFKTKAEEARVQVNSWAENEAKGLIKEVFPPNSIDSSTRLIFRNAIYFKGFRDRDG